MVYTSSVLISEESMRRIAFWICLAGILCLAPVVMANDKNDDGVTDSMVINTVAALKGGKMAVLVEFVNDQELAGLTIPLSVKGSGVKIDSVSFAGSRVEYINTRPVTIDKSGQKVVFGAICMTEDYIAPGRGLMATLYLSGPDALKPEQITVDTTTIHPAKLLFTKASSASFVPAVGHNAPKAVSPAAPKKP